MSEVVQDGVRVVQIVISQAHRSETSPRQHPVPLSIALHRLTRAVSGKPIRLDHEARVDQLRTRNHTPLPLGKPSQEG